MEKQLEYAIFGKPLKIGNEYKIVYERVNVKERDEAYIIELMKERNMSRQECEEYIKKLEDKADTEAQEIDRIYSDPYYDWLA